MKYNFFPFSILKIYVRITQKETKIKYLMIIHISKDLFSMFCREDNVEVPSNKQTYHLHFVFTEQVKGTNCIRLVRLSGDDQSLL